jgi:hypothetical protein
VQNKHFLLVHTPVLKNTHMKGSKIQRNSFTASKYALYSKLHE